MVSKILQSSLAALRDLTQVSCFATFFVLSTTSCTGQKTDLVLAHRNLDAANLPAPDANGPKLGAIAELTAVLEQPAKDARIIGYLHAGAQVARAKRPYSTDECAGGWYPIRPRGFVCAGATATTDSKHPTLLAMALAPKLDQALPYAYARCRKETPIFERDPGKESAVREIGKARAKSVLAVVGSWSAADPEGHVQRLGLMTNGRFVTAADLAAAEPSPFKGVELDDKTHLPIAFIVKRGVHAWRISNNQPEKLDTLDYHSTWALTGRFREISGLKFWALADGRYVRHRDATIVRERNVYPDLARDDQKWIDVSIVNGSAVSYEGKRALFATLVSTGRDRFGDPRTSAVTPLGTFKVAAKYVSYSKHDPQKIADYIDTYDLPWTLELEAGPLVHGAPWHDRFGVEYGLGSVQFAPADAQRLFAWAEPALPENWHAVQSGTNDKPTLVVIRK